MRMSLQYQYMLDMEKERGQKALFKFYDFRGGHNTNYIIKGHHKVRITLWFAILYRCAKFN